MLILCHGVTIHHQLMLVLEKKLVSLKEVLTEFLFCTVAVAEHHPLHIRLLSQVSQHN